MTHGRPTRLNHHLTPRAFTLLELLVIMGILVILTGIASVSYTSLKKHFTRTECMARHNVFSEGVTQYVNEHTQKYPSGSVGAEAEDTDDDGTPDTEEIPDNYIYMNSFAYRDLEQYGIEEKTTCCATIKDMTGLYGETTQPAAGGGGAVDPVPTFQMGFVYWLGRMDIKDVNGDVVYQSRQRADAYYDMSSQTLATCLMYDGNSPNSDGPSSSTDGSFMPHLGTGSARYAAGVTPNPWDSEEPDGVVVSSTDGSVRWTPFKKLTGIMQQNYLWYRAR